MSELIRKRPSSGRAALVISVVALIFALAGTAFSVGSRVPGKNGVKASDIAPRAVKTKKLANAAVKATKVANGAVTAAKIANGAVTSSKLFLSATAPTGFGNIAGEECAGLVVPAAGIRASDHVVVTPPPGWPDTFSVNAHPEPATNEVRVNACNTFTGGGSLDPDGTSAVHVLVIR